MGCGLLRRHLLFQRSEFAIPLPLTSVVLAGPSASGRAVCILRVTNHSSLSVVSVSQQFDYDVSRCRFFVFILLGVC